MVLSCGLQAQEHQTNSTLRTADAKLFLALKTSDLDMLKTAIAEGANPRLCGSNGSAPLLKIIAGRAEPLSQAERECFAYLVQQGADLDPRDADGRTPLIHAARARDLATVRLLVETGDVHVRARDRFHLTALLYASKARHREIVQYLASNGDLQSPTVREQKERGRR
jgi:ankyrin repeat protein